MKLPQLSGREVGRILTRKGFILESQHGSHMKFKKREPDAVRTVIVPNYTEIGPMVLLSIIRQAGMTREEFLSSE